MRIRASLTILAASVSFLAVATTDPEPLICTNANGFPVLAPGDLDVTVPAPSAFLGNEKESGFYLVDLGTEEAPAYEGDTARLDGTMEWTVAVNDYDMVLGSTTTEAFQPVDPPVETASVTVTHCSFVEIGAIDFTAPAPVEELTIQTSLTRNS